MKTGIYGYYDKEKEYVCYIGKDSNIDVNKRHKEHYNPSNYDSQSINRVLQNNSNRYDYFVLAEGDFSDNELNDMEKQAIDIFKTYHYDYPERSVFNFTKGGDGISGYRHTDSTKKKMSKIKSGKNNPMYGRKHSEETKRKMSGENNPMYGRKHSEEAKKKMSENNPNFGTGDSGIVHVSKSKNNKCTQGYIWRYKKRINGKRYRKNSVNLRNLEKNVLKDNQEWIIIDKKKAKQSYQESDKNNKR